MKTAITALAVIAATPLAAGGLSDPIVQTPVFVPANITPDRFAGFYAGGFAGQNATTGTRQEPGGYERSCTPTEGKWGGKCTVSQDDWDNSPELLALGDPLQGHPGGADSLDDPFRYDAGYPGVWAPYEVRYTSATNEEISSRYAQNTVIGEIFNTITDENSDTTYGAFAGYRFNVASGAYAGAEVSASDVMTTAEMTGAISAGNVIFTASGGWADMSGVDGTTFGAAADYYIGRGFVGVKGYRASFDDTDVSGVVARVGWRF